MAFSIFKRIKDKIVKEYQKMCNDSFIAKKRQRQLNNLDFSIISNNCWGGKVYQRYKLSYLTPTVGLYFFSDDYLDFLEHLRQYLTNPITIIDAKDSKYKEVLYKCGQGNVPVGKFSDNCEVIFLHYKTKEEAFEKWTRRAKRVNFENLIIKMSEMNQCTDEHLAEFSKLTFNKKIVFLAKPNKDVPDGIVIKKYVENGRIIDDTTYYDKHTNLTKFINNKSNCKG